MSSQNFEIIGWDFPNLKISISRLLSLARELVLDPTEYCIEAHFQDLDALKHFAEVIPSNRYSCYCWRPIATAKELGHLEFTNIRNARLVFDRTSISIEEDHRLPAYNWDGKPKDTVTIRLVRRHHSPLSEDDKRPSKAIVELCYEIVSSVLGRSLSEPLKTVTEWTEDGRAHNYLMTIPNSKSASIATELYSKLALNNGVSSFEFLGTARQIEDIINSRHYSFDSFPPNCWSFNQGDGKTQFALERAGFLAPIFNLDASRMAQAAATLDSLEARVTRCSIMQRYVAWNLGAGETSPRTRGNYLMLSRQKVGFALFLGFEQHADGEATIQRFGACIAERLESLGIRLKKVVNVR